MMTTTILVLSAICLVLASVAFLLRSLFRAPAGMPDAAWLNSFSVTRYRPMQRLLSDDDFSFLADGGLRDVASSLRSERRRVFRRYLKNLVRDFHRLHRAARILSVESETDRTDFAVRLVELQVAFYWAVMVVQCHLALHALGIGRVDARRLLGAMEGMASGCSSLMPARHYA